MRIIGKIRKKWILKAFAIESVSFLFNEKNIFLKNRNKRKKYTYSKRIEFEIKVYLTQYIHKIYEKLLKNSE